MRTVTLVALGMIAMLLSLGMMAYNKGIQGTLVSTGSGSLENCMIQIGTVGIPNDNSCLCLNVAFESQLAKWTCNGAPSL